MTDQEAADIKSALETAQASIVALEKTNKELKAEKAAEKKKADDAEEAREEASREAATKSGDLDTLRTSLERKHAAELKKLQDANATYETKLSELLIDNTINEAIAKNGVLPHFAPAVTAMLKLGAKMENGEAVSDGMPLTEKVTAWFSSQDASHYVAAPVNSGGAAQGSSAKASSWSKPPETAEEFDRWMKESASNPAATNALADSWSRPDLKTSA